MSSLSTFSVFKHLAAYGDYVLSTEDLKNLQQVLTKMLAEITDVCKRHGIECMLAYGSCLGAVRHHGFIPWDDDLDLGFFREDYERFEAIFDAELGGRYVLQTPETSKNYGLAFSRIRLRGTTLKCRDDYYSDDECGVYIDLLIWDDVPDNVILRALHGFVSLCIGFAYSCRRFAWYGDYYLKLVEDKPEHIGTFKTKIMLGKLFSFLSVDTWTKLWYRWNGLCRGGSSEYVSVPSVRKHYFGEMLKRSTLTPSAELDFGGVTARVPGDFDAYLTAMYGPSYMVPPPESEHEQHIVLGFDLGNEA